MIPLTTEALSRLAAVRDEIKALEDPAKFNMRLWQHADGTPCCLAARLVATDERRDD